MHGTEGDETMMAGGSIWISSKERLVPGMGVGNGPWVDGLDGGISFRRMAHGDAASSAAFLMGPGVSGMVPMGKGEWYTGGDFLELGTVMGEEWWISAREELQEKRSGLKMGWSGGEASKLRAREGRGFEGGVCCH